MELHRVEKVKPLEGFLIRIIFDDQSEFEFDMNPVIEEGGIFSDLKDKKAFESVFVDKISGNVSWPNGADLDTQVLYYEDMAGRKFEVESSSPSS